MILSLKVGSTSIGIPITSQMIKKAKGKGLQLEWNIYDSEVDMEDGILPQEYADISAEVLTAQIVVDLAKQGKTTSAEQIKNSLNNFKKEENIVQLQSNPEKTKDLIRNLVLSENYTFEDICRLVDDVLHKNK
ncbi:MAG TPA: hypothetical protein VIY47_15555 [Ignavibacteriaceae bacterium]